MAYYRTINHDKKFIAFFSPKCGCTTLKDWFVASLELDNSAQRDAALADLHAHTIAARDVDRYPDYRKIFFVRDPFHRLVSFYLHFVVRDTRLWCFADDDGRESLKGKSFAELVALLAELAKRGRPFQHHLEPQLQGVEDVEFDTVVPVERLSAKIAVLNRELGIDYAPKRLNASRYGTAPSEPLYDLKPREIAKRGAPNRGLFYNDRLAGTVFGLYRSDIAFHERHSRASSAVGGRLVAG